MRRIALGLVFVLAGCDYWALSINGDGLIHVTVIGGEPFRPRDGYRIRVTRASAESFVTHVPPSGALRVELPEGEPVTLALLPPDGCVAPPAQSARVGTGPAGAVRFELNCGER